MHQPLPLRHRLRAGRAVARGFTLIELMIVVAIIAILAAVALPAYGDYITRGKIAEATNALAGLRARMEQYFQDNRTYMAVTGVTWPCTAPGTAAKGAFTLSCGTGGTVPTATTYTLRAIGAGSETGFLFTVNEQDVRQSTFPARWGSRTCTTGWIVSKADRC